MGSGSGVRWDGGRGSWDVLACAQETEYGLFCALLKIELSRRTSEASTGPGCFDGTAGEDAGSGGSGECCIVVSSDAAETGESGGVGEGRLCDWP